MATLLRATIQSILTKGKNIMLHYLTESGHVINALVPLSRAMNTSSDVVSVENYNQLSFLIVKGAGAVGTATITVEACDNNTPSNQAKIPFKYRRQISPTDIWGAVTERSAAESFATVAHADDMYEIIVDPADVSNAVVNGARNYHWVRLSVVQVVATAATYGVVAILLSARYGKAVPLSAI